MAKSVELARSPFVWLCFLCEGLLRQCVTAVGMALKSWALSLAWRWGRIQSVAIAFPFVRDLCDWRKCLNLCIVLHCSMPPARENLEEGREASLWKWMRQNGLTALRHCYVRCGHCNTALAMLLTPRKVIVRWSGIPGKSLPLWHTCSTCPQCILAALLLLALALWY